MADAGNVISDARARLVHPGRTEDARSPLPRRRLSSRARKALERGHGLCFDDYLWLYELQDGLCAICAVAWDQALHVDHDHETGAVRGLLCQGCNLRLGRLEHDQAACLPEEEIGVRYSYEWLTAARAYLEERFCPVHPQRPVDEETLRDLGLL